MISERGKRHMHERILDMLHELPIIVSQAEEYGVVNPGTTDSIREHVKSAEDEYRRNFQAIGAEPSHNKETPECDLSI